MVAGLAALAGSLDDFPAPPLLRMISRARRSGTLHVLAAAQPLSLSFEDGTVTYAGPEELGAARAALVATGLVPHDLGAGAPATGSGRAAMDEALRDLAVSTVFELLLPSGAPFWFEAGTSHRLAGSRSLDVEQLIEDSEARLEAWRLIAEVIPSTSVVVRLASLLPPGTGRVTFDRDEWPVLAAIDGRRDVAAIISHTGLSAFGVCGVLHRLITLGVAEPVVVDA